MGFRIEAEFPFEVTPRNGSQTIWIHELHMRPRSGTLGANLADIKDGIAGALSAIWYGLAENDPLNGLVVSAGLDWRDVTILRAYTKYMQQARVSYTPAYIMKALNDHPVLASALVGLFHALHDPALPDSKRRAKDWEQAIAQGLESVTVLDQDRIIRYIKSLVDATLRTNFYQRQNTPFAQKIFTKPSSVLMTNPW